MNEIRVPKVKLPVSVMYSANMTLGGCIYLRRGAPGHVGFQRVREWLHENKRFFPFLEGETKRVRIYNRRNIVSLTYRAGFFIEEEEAEKVSCHELEPIRVILNNGVYYQGQIMEALLPDRRRIVDGLNLSHSFLKLLVRDKIVFVNKRLVRQIEVL